MDTVAGYWIWSQTYDQPGNSAVDMDEPVVKDIVDALPTGILPVGLRVLRCEKPIAPVSPPKPATDTAGPWELWPRGLAEMMLEATRAAYCGVPGLLIWHFQRD